VPIYVANGRVEKGELRIAARDKMESAIKRWRDCRVSITVEKLHAHRSVRQNDAYWSVLIPRIQAAFTTKGITAGRDPVVTHEVLKAQFMDADLVQNGRIRGYLSDTGLLIGTHTPDLSTLQFIDFWDRIADHAAMYWDTVIPQPNPQWREEAEDEAAAIEMTRPQEHAS